jgi:hypothetical protein
MTEYNKSIGNGPEDSIEIPPAPSANATQRNEIQCCRNCGTRAIPTEDGRCPSCRGSFSGGQSSSDCPDTATPGPKTRPRVPTSLLHITLTTIAAALLLLPRALASSFPEFAAFISDSEYSGLIKCGYFFVLVVVFGTWMHIRRKIVEN